MLEKSTRNAGRGDEMSRDERSKKRREDEEAMRKDEK